MRSLTHYALLLYLASSPTFRHSNAEVRKGKFSGPYNGQNEVLALREELKVDGLEEDSTFHGGKGVDRWLTLGSYHDTYLIGVKRRGLSLISISKRIGSLFQAVERQTGKSRSHMCRRKVEGHGMVLGPSPLEEFI